MDLVGKAAWAGNGVAPGAVAMEQFLQHASSDQPVEIVAYEFRTTLPRKSIEMANGIIVLDASEGRIAIPFHALQWLRVLPGAA